MDNNVKLLFAFIIVYSIYEATCLTTHARQPVPFRSGGDASLSFISGEGGQRNPVKPGSEKTTPTPLPNIPEKPTLPSANKPPVQPQTVQNIPKPPGRDFVNPNYKPGVTPSNKPVPNPVASLSYSGAAQNAPTTTKPSGRDYVNPNFKPGAPVQNPNKPIQNPNIPIQNPSPPIQPTNKPPGRDFVNPNFKPIDPFPELKPPTRLGTTPKAPSPKDPFPALKPVGSVGLSNIGITPKPGQSYAQKASEVTTPKPVSPPGQPKPVSPPGQPKTDSITPEPEVGPKDDELREFSETLLKKDVNNAFKHVKLNIQGKTTSQSKNDEAPANLLEVSKEAFNIPTIAKIKLFYNNYILEVTENEYVTPQEKNEENDLVEAVAATPVMQHTRNLLIQHGKVSKDPKDFKDLLKTIWFSMYSRGQGRVGSSGFEHVFLAELKKDKGEVSGLHNWIYFNEAEQTNLANYLGYMKKIDLGEKGAILKFHFTLNGTDKPVNSIFIGTSPEFEMALYTTCYVFRANRICPLQLNGNKFIVRTYPIKYRGKHLLGSAFPEI